MKYFILTEGGKNIGFGHLTRCIALFQAINKIIPEADIEYLFNGDKAAGEFISLHNIKSRKTDWVKNSEKLISIIHNNDKVIIDSYLAPEELYIKLSDKVSGNMLMIDDYNRINYPAGILVNPSIYGKTISYPIRKGTDYLLGREYIILRREFWEVPEKKINNKVENVLITFGATSDSKLIKNIEKQLVNYKVNLISIDTGRRQYTAREMLNFMLNADICISAGGQTTYELARAGIPCIGIEFADNQAFNLKYGSRRGYSKYAGNINDSKLPGRIKEMFKELMPFEKRSEMSKAGGNSVDGKGVKRIVDFLKM